MANWIVDGAELLLDYWVAIELLAPPTAAELRKSQTVFLQCDIGDEAPIPLSVPCLKGRFRRIGSA